MTKLIVVTRDGQDVAVEATVGMSVMENIRAAQIDELLAICGGCLSCATCHVHVDSDWLDVVGPPGEEENDLLDGSDHRRDDSRLSCQIPVTPVLNGLRVRIAAED